MVVLAYHRIRNGAVERWIVASLIQLYFLIEAERLFKFLFLGVEFSQRAQFLEVVWFDFDLLFMFSDESVKIVLGFYHAVFLFQRSRFFFVFEDVSIGTRPVRQRIVPPFLHCLAGRN